MSYRIFKFFTTNFTNKYSIKQFIHLSNSLGDLPYYFIVTASLAIMLT